YRHPRGGHWDEWYARFADGRLGWLAEAQGRFFLTFEHAPGGAPLPAFGGLAPGTRIAIGGPAEFVVTEVSTAEPMSAEGEVPYRLAPGQSLPFADLSGPRGAFATIDY